MREKVLNSDGFKLDEDKQSQIDRARELLGDLEISIRKDILVEIISKRSENLTQELLVKLRNLLDQVMHKVFERYYSQTLQDKESVKIYFPIVLKKEDLKAILGRSHMKSLETDYPDVYRYIESVQPYNEGCGWLKSLSKYSNEKHVRLTPQIVKKENETILGGIVRVGRGAKGVQMHNCLISGIPVDSDDINETPVKNFDPRLNVQRKTYITYVFEGSDVNVLSLCRIAIEGVEKIVNDISKKLDN